MVKILLEQISSKFSGHFHVSYPLQCVYHIGFIWLFQSWNHIIFMAICLGIFSLNSPFGASLQDIITFWKSWIMVPYWFHLIISIMKSYGFHRDIHGIFRLNSSLRKYIESSGHHQILYPCKLVSFDYFSREIILYYPYYLLRYSNWTHLSSCRG